MKVTLEPNEGKVISEEGYGFYYKSGTGLISVEFLEADGQVTAAREFLSGQGTEGDRRFKAVVVKNIGTTEQTFELDIAERRFVDNRMVSDVNGIISVINNGGTGRVVRNETLVAATAKEVLVSDLDRLKAAIFTKGDVFIGADNTVDNTNGYPIPDGTDWLDENTAPLWFYCVAGCDVVIIEDRK